MKKAFLMRIFRYFKDHRMIYFGVVLCNFCCFTFHTIFRVKDEPGTALFISVSLFFVASFIFPIILGLIFTARCFTARTRKQLLSNIIHAYIGTILIFAALFYQCCVFGDFLDAVHKREMYSSQLDLKKSICPDLKIMRVADRRAFQGIKPRIWSGYDYPSGNLLFGNELNPDCIHSFLKNDYEDLSVEQIERLAGRTDKNTRVIEYQKQNVTEVYVDCLYFSVACIATVGFGDISPSLWFTKLFAALEVFFGLSIFVFAIGMLFSKWTVSN